MSFPPLLTPSEARPLIPRARGTCRPRASPRPERSTRYLRQPTPAHVAYRRCLSLQRNPSQPGHSFRWSSKSPISLTSDRVSFSATAFTLPLFFRFLSQLDLRSV